MNKIISIGHSCVPAFYIRRLLKQPEAYPFDWLVVPPPALIDLVKNRFNMDKIFDDLIVHEQPKPNKDYIPIKNQKSEIIFYHDFKKNNWNSHINEVKQKYKFLTSRLDSTLQSSKITLIRHHIKIDECKELIKALDENYSQHYKLITVNECKPENDWNLPNVKNISIKSSSAWNGDVNEWQRVFKLASQ